MWAKVVLFIRVYACERSKTTCVEGEITHIILVFFCFETRKTESIHYFLVSSYLESKLNKNIMVAVPIPFVDRIFYGAVQAVVDCAVVIGQAIVHTGDPTAKAFKETRCP